MGPSCFGKKTECVKSLMNHFNGLQGRLLFFFFFGLGVTSTSNSPLTIQRGHFMKKKLVILYTY